MITALAERAIAALESIAKSLPELADRVHENNDLMKQALAFREKLVGEDTSQATAPVEAAQPEAPAAEPEKPKRTRATPKAATKVEPEPEPVAEEEPEAETSAEEEEDEDALIDEAQAAEILKVNQGYYVATDAAGIGRAKAKADYVALRDRYGIQKSTELKKSKFDEFVADLKALYPDA